MSKAPRSRGYGASATKERLDFSSSDDWKALFAPAGKGKVLMLKGRTLHFVRVKVCSSDLL